MPLNQAIELIGSIAVNLGLKISLFFLVIAFADFAYQKYKFNKDIKMTKQEVKDEYKNAEGDPQIKGKIRQRSLSEKNDAGSDPGGCGYYKPDTLCSSN